MKLMSEEGHQRVYLGNDMATWYEVRAEMRGVHVEAKRSDLRHEERFAERAAAAKAQLHAWFSDRGDDLGLEPFGEVDVFWADPPGQPLDLSQDATIWVVAERRCWPPEPADPDPPSTEPPPSFKDIVRGPNT